MLHLDGSSFSGSGTIVRFGLPLAALTGQALHLTNIRARRASPGLRPQHLKAVQAVTQLCQGSLEGAAVGSRELIFRPGRVPQGGRFRWDIGTAGSTTMLAFALLPLAALAPGMSEWRIPQVTDHVHTNIWLVETMLGTEVHIDGQCLRVQGVGYTPSD